MKKILKAPAKINLCLRVNKKLDDGYHDLTMIMQPISLFDTIEIEIIDNKANNKVDLDFLNIFNDKRRKNNSEEQINLKCNFSYIPTDDRNLVVKVIKYIFEKYSIKDQIYVNLKKLIPTGGGLGGGSSDAGTILTFLNNHYNLKLTNNELSEIAFMFGADIPFFIHRKECICEGKGEKITEIEPFNNYFVLIATPNINVSTKEVYSKIDNYKLTEQKRQQNDIAFKNCLDAIKKRNLNKLANNIFNDLEPVTEDMFYDVKLYKKRLLELGASSSLMSGSGPSVFGLFNSYFKALNCKNILKKENKSSFVFLSRPI